LLQRIDFFAVHGYTDAELFADRRFRVTVALHQAGLDKTGYGQRIIAAMPTTKSASRSLSTLHHVLTGPHVRMHSHPPN